MDGNQQIIDRIGVIHRLAAQIIVISCVDDRLFATVHGDFENASVEEAQGAGLNRSGATFTVEGRVWEYATGVDYMFSVFSHFLLRHFAD